MICSVKTHISRFTNSIVTPNRTFVYQVMEGEEEGNNSIQHGCWKMKKREKTNPFPLRYQVYRILISQSISLTDPQMLCRV